MGITEKVAYVRGLMSGLDIPPSSKEGKIFEAVIDILDEMAGTIAEVEEELDAVSEQVSCIDEDMQEVFSDLYGDDDEDDGDDSEDEDDFDGELYEIVCPKCSDTLCIDEDMLDDGEIVCPSCGETLEFDLSGFLDDSCGCEECNHEHRHDHGDSKK